MSKCQLIKGKSRTGGTVAMLGLPATRLLYLKGDLPMRILNVPSPNFQVGRRSFRPEGIVIHIMQGTLYGTDSWFQSAVSKASAHYGVGKWGEVHQYVKEQDTASHTGRAGVPRWSMIKHDSAGNPINPDYYTIGIEHEGDLDTDWTPEMYDMSSSLICTICSRWNIPIDREHIIGRNELYQQKRPLTNTINIDLLITLAREKQDQRKRSINAILGGDAALAFAN